jgi:hypothetical protein
MLLGHPYLENDDNVKKQGILTEKEGTVYIKEQTCLEKIKFISEDCITKQSLC